MISLLKIIINVTQYHSFQSVGSIKKLYICTTLRNIPKIVYLCEKEYATGKFFGEIPIDHLDITYSRSSAPGGQNVNTVSTKVDLRFHVESASWLNDDLKKKIINKVKKHNIEIKGCKFYTCERNFLNLFKNKPKINKEGYIIIRSDVTRSQTLNLADAINKLRLLIIKAEETAQEPSLETKIIMQKRLEKQKRERLCRKRHRSLIKKDRQTPNFIDL